MEDKNTNKEEDKNKAEEPAASYYHKLRIFSSFEEANEADYKERAEIPPIQHLKDTVQLIIRMYNWSEQLRGKKASDNKIRIIRYE